MSAGQNTKASKEVKNPSEASYRHLQVTPPHDSIQRVLGVMTTAGDF